MTAQVLQKLFVGEEPFAAAHHVTPARWQLRGSSQRHHLSLGVSGSCQSAAAGVVGATCQEGWRLANITLGAARWAGFAILARGGQQVAAEATGAVRITTHGHHAVAWGADTG